VFRFSFLLQACWLLVNDEERERKEDDALSYLKVLRLFLFFSYILVMVASDVATAD
jgi:hypothetical protein